MAQVSALSPMGVAMRARAFTAKTSAAVTPPDMPGAEFTVWPSRAHFTADESRAHFTAGGRAHFAADEEDVG